MTGIYLVCILLSLCGLAAADWRYRLAFFYDWKRTVLILLVTLVVFIIWDVLGIGLGIFFIGSERFLLGLHVGEFPLEELFFLVLLSYSSLLVYRFIRQNQENI